MTYNREEFERDQMGQTGDDLRQKATTPIDTPALLTMTAERHAEIERTEWPKGRVPIVMAELLDEIAAQAALVQRLMRERDSEAERAELACGAAEALRHRLDAAEKRTDIWHERARTTKTTIARLTAELARAQDTVRRDTETMAAERDVVTPVNFAAIAATLKAECERQHAEVTRLTAVIAGHREWLVDQSCDAGMVNALDDLDQRLGPEFT